MFQIFFYSQTKADFHLMFLVGDVLGNVCFLILYSHKCSNNIAQNMLKYDNHFIIIATALLLLSIILLKYMKFIKPETFFIRTISLHVWNTYTCVWNKISGNKNGPTTRRGRVTCGARQSGNCFLITSANWGSASDNMSCRCRSCRRKKKRWKYEIFFFRSLIPAWDHIIKINLLQKRLKLIPI